ncbi:MAG: hypothetical protein LBM00_08195 [Deltaproteobacteria bacterium]|jgi:hypothetical protein|nr:hypothetical protein [Deltaproteobacteria bacterium]
MERIVRTKKELEAAKNDDIETIVIVGQLATDVKKSEKIIKYAIAGGAGTAALCALAATAAPVTGGLSFFVAAPVLATPIVTMTGIEIAAIILAISIGLTLLIALFKDYEEISYENCQQRLVLKKKKTV